MTRNWIQPPRSSRMPLPVLWWVFYLVWKGCFCIAEFLFKEAISIFFCFVFKLSQALRKFKSPTVGTPKCGWLILLVSSFALWGQINTQRLIISYKCPALAWLVSCQLFLTQIILSTFFLWAFTFLYFFSFLSISFLSFLLCVRCVAGPLSPPLLLFLFLPLILSASPA